MKSSVVKQNRLAETYFFRQYENYREKPKRSRAAFREWESANILADKEKYCI